MTQFSIKFLLLLNCTVVDRILRTDYLLETRAFVCVSTNKKLLREARPFDKVAFIKTLYNFMESTNTRDCFACSSEHVATVQRKASLYSLCRL